MQLTLRDDLVLAVITVAHQGHELAVPDVVVDTGSATTILAADALLQIGIAPEPYDILYTVQGVGGTEAVFSRGIDRLQVGPASVEAFEIEVGGMDYGLPINGILGMDFLLAAGAVIDLRRLELEFGG